MSKKKPVITDAHVEEAVLTVQQKAPKAPREGKINTALSLIALLAGLTSAVVPKAQVTDVTGRITATVAALQASGVFTRDRAPK